MSWLDFTAAVDAGAASRDAAASGSGSTLNGLATLFGSIGGAIGTTYKSIAASRVPATNIPQSSFNVSVPGAKAPISIGNLLVYAVIGIAIFFGIKAMRA